jgi:hypothetical protein
MIQLEINASRYTMLVSQLKGHGIAVPCGLPVGQRIHE